MFRIKANWVGGAMGTGLSVWHVDSEDIGTTNLTEILDSFNDFFTPIKGLFPNSLTIQVSNEVENRAETTGTLGGTATGPVQTVHTGEGSSAYPAGVGMRVKWPTDHFSAKGRRSVGSTFLVPILGGQFESNGTLYSGAVSAVQGAADALLARLETNGSPLVVWTKPTTVGGSDGLISPVTGALVPDRVSWLTTRRS